MSSEQREITFRIFRYNPKREFAPRWEEYKVVVDRSTTVLDALLRIKEEQDPTLVVRYSCRQAVCGSCGMMINGRQRLACFTRVLELGTDVVEVAPLKNYPVIRDLVADFSDLFEKEKLVAPYIIEKAECEEDSMHLQSEEELMEYLEFADCIECGLCASACPTCATDPLFLGPMVLNKAYRFLADSRDNGLDVRLPVLDSEQGCWRCHFAAACSSVCPKGVDPAKAVQFLKRMITGRSIFGRRKEKHVKLFSLEHARQELELPEAD